MWRFLKTVGLAFLASSARGFAADIPEEDGVLVLDPTNFDDAVAQNPTLLVEFYAPWCGHCKKLAPEYAKAAEELSKDGLKIAKVDCDKHKSLAQEYGVGGFPTLKLLREGTASDYSGGRTKDDIVSYVKKKSGPPSKTLGTEDEVKTFAEESEVVVIGLFASADSDSAKAFNTVAASEDKIAFGVSSSPEVLKVYEASEGDKIVILKKFDELKSMLPVTPKTTEEEIAEFIDVYSMRLVTTFSIESSPSIFGGSIQKHLLFMADEKADKFEDQMGVISQVAEKNRGKVLHVHVPPSEERVLSFFGATADTLPMSVLADMSGEGAIKKYNFEGELTVDALVTFEEKAIAGELKPSLKSEEPEEADMAEPVKVLKGKSFKEHVLDNEKDVMVEFYAPWCGHCKALAPKYDEIAQNLSGVDTVMIAKMDSTANEIDVDGVEVTGFPTLYFFPGKDKSSPVRYGGARDVDGITKFIQEKASTPFKLEETEKEPVAEEL